MANWKVQGIDSKAIPFDYGLYNENSGNFWHANHAQTDNPNDPMRVYESDNNYFSNQYPGAFNRTVYSVGLSPYREGVDKSD